MVVVVTSRKLQVGKLPGLFRLEAAAEANQNLTAALSRADSLFFIRVRLDELTAKASLTFWTRQIGSKTGCICI
jgi:hypothetical protein